MSKATDKLNPKPSRVSAKQITSFVGKGIEEDLERGRAY